MAMRGKRERECSKIAPSYYECGRLGEEWVPPTVVRREEQVKGRKMFCLVLNILHLREEEES